MALAAATVSLTAARHHEAVLREKAFAAKHATRRFIVGRADTFEACWCGHLHQRLVGDQWLIITATIALLATARSSTTTLALLAHLLAGAAWSGEGAADTTAGKISAHVVHFDILIPSFSDPDFTYTATDGPRHIASLPPGLRADSVA